MNLRILPCLLLFALIAACGSELPATKSGAPAPAFTLERLDGASVRFPEQYQGQVVVLRFWADWCPYCHSEMQALEPVYRQYRDRGLVILAVNVMQPLETVQKFVQEIGISYETLLDRQGEVMRRYQVMGLPMTYIIDRQGIVRARIIGESTPEVFTQAISSLL
ncbi:MAG TPA: TlpA disulfide reductase family protein [Candidatus Competibacteraceae bacterium]|nr:TlpA disulfide reductase family protein [Candidatus Competibacteraceae bacterium]HRZ05739.1 TlpA disulfide reductase family protein [Candidatus Competibacteraceae bacterium]HSA45885.1 TlpA disulfide reductase family protein [Candidatus Competibacteraceae bacterium]